MRSAMQKLNFPGWPWVDLSEMPGSIWNTLRRISRVARPIVALGRLPGPNRLTSEFMPISSASGPLTISSGADPPVLAVEPWKLKSGRSIASKAATTMGKCSGRHPAITAFTAAACSDRSRPVAGCREITVSGGRLSAASIAFTRSTAGGTTGKPSVQPCSKQKSMAPSRSSGASWMRGENAAIKEG